VVQRQESYGQSRNNLHCRFYDAEFAGYKLDDSERYESERQAGADTIAQSIITMIIKVGKSLSRLAKSIFLTFLAINSLTIIKGDSGVSRHYPNNRYEQNRQQVHNCWLRTFQGIRHFY
jgi:hypothetical protein